MFLSSTYLIDITKTSIRRCESCAFFSHLFFSLSSSFVSFFMAVFISFLSYLPTFYPQFPPSVLPFFQLPSHFSPFISSSPNNLHSYLGKRLYEALCTQTDQRPGRTRRRKKKKRKKDMQNSSCKKRQKIHDRQINYEERSHTIKYTDVHISAKD